MGLVTFKFGEQLRTGHAPDYEDNLSSIDVPPMPPSLVPLELAAAIVRSPRRNANPGCERAPTLICAQTCVTVYFNNHALASIFQPIMYKGNQPR